MATKIVGAGGDYPTIAEYAAYWNALASISEPEYCNILPGGEIVDSTAVTLNTLPGMSDSNRLFIRPAAGGSFRDHANVRTNALRYNAANGAALYNTGDGIYALTTGDFVTIEGLQFRGANGVNIPVRLGSNCVFRYNIAEANTTAIGVLNAVGDNSVVEKNVIIQKGTAAGLIVNGSFAIATGNTIVALAGGSAGIQMDSALAPVCKNNVVIGFTTDYSMTAGDGSTNNATGNAAFSGTGYDINGQTNVAVDEFFSLTPGSEDLRLSATSVKLKDSGATAGTAEDISGLGQPSGIAYDIGAWEFGSPVAPPTVTITDQVYDGQDVTISGTTTGDPTSISGSLTVDGNPDATQEPSSHALGVGTFTVTFTGAPTDLEFTANISVVNDGGMATATGTPFTIPDVSGSPVAPSEGTPATSVTLSGPASGNVGTASSNFTVGANGGITGTIVVTPSDGGAGGTFNPAAVSISAALATRAFTYTPGSTGAKTISVTNDGGLANPSAVTYEALPPNEALPPTVTLTLVEEGDGTPLGSLINIKWWSRDHPEGPATDYGIAESTDGAGVMVIQIPNTTKASGEIVRVELESADGTRSWVGNVEVD